MGLITTEDKEQFQDKPLVAEKNKFTADNYNELKREINNNFELISSLLGSPIISGDAALTLQSFGVYVYNGNQDATWTLPPLGQGWLRIKNRSNFNLNLVPSGSERIYTNKQRTNYLLFSNSEFITLIAEEFWTI